MRRGAGAPRRRSETGRAPRPARAHLRQEGFRGEDLRSLPVDGRREGLHDPGAFADGSRKQRPRPLRHGDGRAARDRAGVDARRRRREAPRGGRLLVVGRRQASARLRQREAGLAPEDAGRLLGPRRGGRQAPEARGRRRRGEPHVRQVLTGRLEGRVRPRQRPLGRRSRNGQDHSADGGRVCDDHQRHRRLGLRGGVRDPRRLPLEPEWREHRLLALRRQRRRRLPADQRHRHDVSRRDALPLPHGRDDESGRAHRRRAGRGRRPRAHDRRSRASARSLHPAHGVGGRDGRDRRPADEPAAEHQRRLPGRSQDRPPRIAPSFTTTTTRAPTPCTPGAGCQAATCCGSAISMAGGTPTRRRATRRPCIS